MGEDAAQTIAKSKLNLLLVEEDAPAAELLLREIQLGGLAVYWERVQTAQDMTEALRRRAWDIVISNYSLPDFDALAALSILKAANLDVPLIVVSGTIGEERAVGALRAGASDFLLKEQLARLVPTIERELKEARARTSRAMLEERLRQTQKLETLGTLAAGVAHDFNNLLSVIIGFATIGLELVGPDDTLRADLQQIKHAGERAADLTAQLLAMSRRQLLEPKNVDLNEILLGMRAMLRRVLGAQNKLVVSPSSKVCLIHADPGQIEQVVMNLVVNARDAMPDGGQISIETHHVEIDDDATASLDLASGEYVMLSVADTGGGIDEATRQRIFEPFFTTKERGKGTGLGLSTVLGIVQQSGGHVTVDSSRGRGATFKIYFPRVHGKSELPRARTLPPLARGGSETVLIVDDDEQVRTVARAVLERSGYQVLDAQNGGEAFLVCENQDVAFDLVITDLNLPRMSGLELARRLTAMRPTLRVLYMSGFVAEPRSYPPTEGGTTFLQKPIRPASLLAKVREVLDGP
jgi:signal transduction histidine kinase